MVAKTTNYQFLETLHRELQPRAYLEIGVRWGDSLRLAQCPALGVDPELVHRALRPNEKVHRGTSDEFFTSHWDLPPGYRTDQIDLVYIDGMHLVENALADFANAAQWANEHTVVVFDDVLPYSAAIATRTQPPGDWAGDVWRVIPILRSYLHRTRHRLVDIHPTGALVVWGIDPADIGALDADLDLLLHAMSRPTPGWDATTERTPPPEVLNRQDAVTPDQVLAEIKEGRA